MLNILSHVSTHNASSRSFSVVAVVSFQNTFNLLLSNSIEGIALYMLSYLVSNNSNKSFVN